MDLALEMDRKTADAAGRCCGMAGELKECERPAFDRGGIPQARGALYVGERDKEPDLLRQPPDTDGTAGA